jgi:SPASM domain peptide maturase of grasp-with-spasm system
LFDTVKFINGYNKSVICDFDRNKIKIVQNSLYDFCKDNSGQTIKEIKLKYSVNQHLLLFEYLDFLTNNEFAYIGSLHDMMHFSPINLEWDYHSQITNMVIEHSVFNYGQLNSIINQINMFEVEAFEYICLGDFINLEDLENIIRTLQQSDSLRCLKLQIKYNSLYTTERMSDFLKRNLFLQTLVIFSSPFSYIEENKNSLHFIQQTINIKFCGNIHPNYFSLNLPLFTESQAHNTCLNRKLCIDAEGNIKNCPAMERSFGNIKDTTLQEAIEKPGFKDLWFVHKDQIDVCKDCEFRHLCMDCRCFIKDPENIYSQPAKCTYNPYICKWQGQEDYVPVEECGSYSRETGFVPNHEKIKELNQQIWGEDDE